MATRVLLIRHAESVWNAEGRWQGQADPALSPTGAAAAAAVRVEGLAGVASSDLARAFETASLIAATHGLEPVMTIRGLRERGAGVWTGLTRAEIDEGWPGLRGSGDEVPDIPGGESPAAVTARAVAALHRISDQWPDASVLAVTHGALIRLVEIHCGEAPSAVPNLGGRWVTVSAEGVSAGEVVRLTLVDAAEGVG